jgi:hypothetical protein
VNRIFVTALLAMCCVDAQAKAVAYIPNKAGGRITFTDQPCPMGLGSGAIVYTATKGDPEPHMGCWTVNEYKPAQITVKWIDLESKVTYSIADLRRLDSV